MERRLAAILAADVVGYSRLMGADEEGTLTALNAHRSERYARRSIERLDYDFTKNIKGIMRHIVTQTDGHLVGVQVHTVEIQDHDDTFDLL